MLSQKLFRFAFAILVSAALVLGLFAELVIDRETSWAAPGQETERQTVPTPSPIPPPNDDFKNATVISSPGFRDTVDISGASVETGEPTPDCAYDMGHTIWYAFAPTESGSYSAYIEDAWFSNFHAAYTGNALPHLLELACRAWGGMLTVQMDAGTTYYFQAGGMYGDSGQLTFNLDVAPQPEAQFGFWPDQPSIFDQIWFENWSWDPADVGFEAAAWDFGDGTTATEWSTSHRYAADGDYTVQLEVTTEDGRTASTAQDVYVKTHDVAITKFAVPLAAMVGHTRRIIVGVNSRRYPERVEVVLYKSIPWGFEWVGTLNQFVAVRRLNRTTDFAFSYTFTDEDAWIGTVTFRAEAHIIDAMDALPADNEAISPPVKVR